jgi:Arc/MetJ family transcription regulator
MRTTLDLPDDLVEEAMHITEARTKTEMIKKALINLIDQHKRERILRYHGKLGLDMDMDVLRDR